MSTVPAERMQKAGEQRPGKPGRVLPSSGWPLRMPGAASACHLQARLLLLPSDTHKTMSVPVLKAARAPTISRIDLLGEKCSTFQKD